MSTFLRNKTISKTTPLRKENPFPQFNVASYKRPGIRLPFEYTTTLLSGEGAEERTGTATMFRKMLPKDAIFSTVLSTIVVTCTFSDCCFPPIQLAFWLFWKQMWPVLVSSTLSGHPVLDPNFFPDFAWIYSVRYSRYCRPGYRLTNCQFTNEPNREISRGVFQNHGTFGQAFPPPAVLAHPSIFHFFCFPSNSVTRLGTLSDEG